MLKFYFFILPKKGSIMYQHLTVEQRYQIQAYKKAGYTQKDIAKEIEVHPSTVSRELKRNSSVYVSSPLL